MKKLFSALTLLMAAGVAAQAYNCPANLYFYVSEATSSTAFEKNQTVFTYTVDATAGDVFGVIVASNAKSWNEAHSTNTYIPGGKWGDIEISGATSWDTMDEWTGTTNNQWSNGCLKFVKGKKYDITLTHANGSFSGVVAVEGETPVEQPETAGFEIGKDYFIDANACTWFFDAGAVIYVWDGNDNVKCEEIGGGILKFTPSTAGVNGLVYVKRTNPASIDEVWNEYALSAPTDAAANMFVITSDFKGGEWKTYATPDAWLISQNINEWSAAAKSDYIFDYDEATGLYTIEVPAAKLIAEGDGNGFKIGYGNLNDWDNYYGAVVAGKVMGNKIAADAVKNGQNFIIPDDATTPIVLTFDLLNKKLTAEWKENDDPVIVDPIGPVDSDDVLAINLPKMDVNGSVTVEVTLNAAADKDYCSAQWDIVVPKGFKVSDITLNTDRCPDHELLTNEVDGVIKCIVYSAKNTAFVRVARPLFSFKLTAENAQVGEVKGSLSNIIFNVAPSDGNLNIASKFADTPLDITVVKAVTKITAEPANLALHNGDSQEITLAIEPADATDKTVTWEIVSGENVISLADGTVTAKASGIATIKVTANDGFGASVTIDVTVDGRNVETITLSETEHTMYVGEDFTLTATVTPDDATNKAVMWVSSDDNVATVEDGHVVGRRAGEAFIYAIARDGSGVQAACSVTVKAKVSGDADGDDQLTIADIVIIAKQSIDIATEGALLENMDMDRDGTITATDVTLAVYYLNLEDARQAIESAQMTANQLSLTTPVAMGGNKFNIPLYMPAARNMAGIQFDVVLPEGMTLSAESYVAPEASNGHSICVTEIADRTYRVIMYSGRNFNANSLGYLTVDNGTGLTTVDIDINNVMYSDGSDLNATDDARHTLSFVAAGIDSILSDNPSARYDVYNVAGVQIASKATKAEVKALPAGIYVIGGQKVAVL